MKKKKILAICLGISFVFSGSFCVFAKVIKKTISGRFKYSLNIVSPMEALIKMIIMIGL